MSKVLFIAAIVLTLMSCSQEQPRRRMPSRDDLIEYNRKLVHRDSMVIATYCRAQNLDTVPSRQGLWMTITSEGGGRKIESGNVVTLAYRISDIDGTEYYTSERDGHKQIAVGSGQDIVALDMALTQLQLGAKATIIAMPDQAYGLVGDENRIRGRRILRYDVEVLAVE